MHDRLHPNRRSWSACLASPWPPRSGVLLALLLAVCHAPAWAASPKPGPSPVSIPEDIVFINNLTYDAGRHSIVLAITGAITVSSRVVMGPPRMVIDIPGANLAAPNRELYIHDALFERVRVSQFKIWPPTVRVVIETSSLREPIMAIQQTGKRLYITLAPERTPEDGDHGHPHGAAPSEVPATPVIEASAPVLPIPGQSSAAGTPRPATPRPTARPVPRRSTAVPAEVGESKSETLPGLPTRSPREP